MSLPIRHVASGLTPVAVAPTFTGLTTLLLTKTRHRASTSMYSLTFCVRVMSPERHH